MSNGLVFNIQKYSIRDGPGIRTTVFLKGCLLECAWCQNPESQVVHPAIEVLEGRCIRCGACRQACPQDGGDGDLQTASLPSDACIRCGACVAACPTGGREMVGRMISVDELMVEVLSDRIYYDDSGGGVTFSGGEPLLQFNFLMEALARCRTEGIHTALDTSGYARPEEISAAAKLTDLFLYDVKLIDEQLHRRYTGVSNDNILANLRKLGHTHAAIWVRIPLIPGVNNDTENLHATAKLVSDLPGVRRVELLPYHNLGSHKMPSGNPNTRQLPTTQDFERPSPAALQEAAKQLRSHGLTVHVHGFD